MPSFYGIHMVRTGLAAHQRALETVGQNVANAATKGYSRREVSFTAAQPLHVVQGAGRGIADVQVLRYRDNFMDKQFRAKAGAFGYQQTRAYAMQQVELAVGDLSETGLRASLDELFTAWDSLALRPNDPNTRVGVITATQTFLDQAKGVYRDLTDMRKGLDEEIQTRVELINQGAQQLAAMNKQIRLGQINPEQHDLMDQRDMLIDSLAQLAGVSATRLADGTVELHLGSLPLVDREVAYQLTTSLAQDSFDQSVWLTQLQWNGDTTIPFNPPGGELKALMEVRDERIPAYISYLDNLVKGVAEQINALHPATPPVYADPLDPLSPIVTPAGEEFFTIATNLLDVRINAAIVADHMLIRAGTTGESGDADVARAIARLRDEAFMTGAPTTPSGGPAAVKPGDYLRAISSVLGLEVQDAMQRADLAHIQLNQADRYRESVAGVSLDDEMTKMIQYQQAYNAAARMMTALDELLDMVVNRTGLVGR